MCQTTANIYAVSKRKIHPCLLSVKNHPCRMKEMHNKIPYKNINQLWHGLTT